MSEMDTRKSKRVPAIVAKGLLCNVLMPASLSMVGAIKGWLNKSPMYGIDLRNCTIVPKKSPKRPSIPKLSMINPKNDLFIKIKSIPMQKHMVPLIFVGSSKNVIVRCGPIINIKPITNKIFPNAKNAESKNAIIPKMKKKKPPAVNPTPNSITVLVDARVHSHAIMDFIIQSFDEIKSMD